MSVSVQVIQGGYDHDFVDPPKDLECPVCMLVLRDPHLISCCGNHFCRNCISRVRLEGRNCPICNLPGFSVLLDKGLQRSIRELQIFCVNKDRGCTWVGALSKLQDHTTPTEREKHGCKFEVVECSQGCGEKYQRRFIREHLKKACICRRYMCNHCDYESFYEDVRRNHWPVCPNYPVACPNECEVGTLARSELEKHLMEVCPLEDIECEFSYAGCKTKIKRKDMTTHMNDSGLKHLSQLSAVSLSLLQNVHRKEEQISQLKRENQVLKQKFGTLKTTYEKETTALENRVKSLELQLNPVPPFSFTMSNFEEHKRAGDRWFGPSFYSHPGGYKMCARVDANGIGIGKGTHVSILIHLVAGQYDDQLQWPFQGSITMQLLNQRGGTSHLQVTIPFTEAPKETTTRVQNGSIATWGWGCYTFIPQEDLRYNPQTNCEYLSNNCLQFTVTDIAVQ